MQDAYNKLARILRTDPKVLLELDRKMTAVSGQEGVLESVAQQNTILVDRTLSELGLDRNSSAQEVYGALLDRLVHLDGHLFQLLDKPDLSKLSERCGKLCDVAFRVFTPPRGLFIKRERAVKLLDKYPPVNMLKSFGCANAAEMVEKHGFAATVSGLRFMESKEWMHKFFDEAYSELTPDDFEEREVELKVLSTDFMAKAGDFVKKKRHNLSHLKEYGIIFIVPIPLEIYGETIRLFTLILHYLHEVPFYAALTRGYMEDPDFAGKLKSMLRGDVPKGPAPDGGKVVWRVVQQYLTKDDPNDFRLFEPHVNPEAEHWYKAEEDLGRLNRMLEIESGRMNLGYWTGLDFVGDFFKDSSGEEVLVSFDLIDLIMSLVVEKGRGRQLYHQQEAMWNKIFIEYIGRERMNQLINQNIISGFIEL